MNKKQKILVGIIAAAVVAILLVWISGAFSSTSTTADGDKTIQIVITTEDEELANESLDVMEDDTLMTIMEENFEMDLTDEGFVEAIEGAEQTPDDNLFWVFEVNEEMVTVGAEEFIPEDQDNIHWELMAF